MTTPAQVQEQGGQINDAGPGIQFLVGEQDRDIPGVTGDGVGITLEAAVRQGDRGGAGGIFQSFPILVA